MNKKLQHIIGLMLLTTSTTYAATANFNCPQPSEINSTDFTTPSIWVAPPVPHSVPGAVGVGLGGKEAKEFIKAEAATVSHKKGWVCLYKSKGGLSISEYKAKIKHLTESNPYLKKYLSKVNAALQDAEPFLKNYPNESAIGFVGYQEQEL